MIQMMNRQEIIEMIFDSRQMKDKNKVQDTVSDRQKQT